MNLFIFVLLISVQTNAQKISFPESFKSTPAIWTGLRLAPIDNKLKKEGLTSNPLIVTDQKDFGKFTRLQSIQNLMRIYMELYTSTKNDFDDAGVVVFEYKDKPSLQEALPEFFAQGNVAYLMVENYLIQIWSDGTKGSQPMLLAATKYYKLKLGAKVYEAQEDPSIETLDHVEEIKPEHN